MFNKKGQAAMEFLTTYGWAFLIIIVVIAGLSYMGVFSFLRVLPDSCDLQGDFSCGESFAIVNDNIGTLQIELKNNLAEKVNITEITLVERSLASSGKPIVFSSNDLFILSGVDNTQPCGGLCPNDEYCDPYEGCRDRDLKEDNLETISSEKTTAIKTKFKPISGKTVPEMLESAGITAQVGKKATFIITIKYKILGSNIVKTQTGTITTTVREA